MKTDEYKYELIIFMIFYPSVNVNDYLENAQLALSNERRLMKHFSPTFVHWKQPLLEGVISLVFL